MKRTILISGASRGIGRAISEKLFLEGHSLSLGVRQTESLNNTILDPNISGNERLLVHKYEATNRKSANLWVLNSIDKFRSIDTIIHCAGIFNNVGLTFKEEEEHLINNLWETNLKGPWYLTNAAWEQLSHHGQARIIVLVSMSGKRSKGNLAGYCVSKFALMGLCQTMRNEGWEKGIRVSTISPGWVNTDMAANVNSMKKGEMTQPSDLANLISEIILLPNSCIPFEVNINCSLEK